MELLRFTLIFLSIHIFGYNVQSDKDAVLTKSDRDIQTVLLKIREQEALIDSLFETTRKQNMEIQALIEKDRVNSVEIARLKQITSDAVQSSKDCSKTCENFGSLINKTGLQGGIMNSMPVRRQSASGHTAFYAHLSSTHANPGIHQNIIFNRVQLNIGDAYDGNSGIFTVPTSGLYAFTWTVVSSGHGHVFTDLVVNGKVYGGIIGDSDDTLALSVGATTVVLDAKAGDRVYVWTTDHQAPTANIISTEGARSSFAGWLIA